MEKIYNKGKKRNMYSVAQNHISHCLRESKSSHSQVCNNVIE